MSKIFSKSTAIRLPPSRGVPSKAVDKNEVWGRDFGGVFICPRCQNVHYKKKWHHAGDLPTGSKEKPKEMICLACKMIKEHTFEGEILIKNFSLIHEKELLNLISVFGKRATEIDPQDRIIKTENFGNYYRITTTENQLAVKLAKKIAQVFSGLDLSINYSKEPSEVVRITISKKD